MIAQLTGRIVALEDGRCVVDVNGVGYLVHASTRTLAAMSPRELVNAIAAGDRAGLTRAPGVGIKLAVRLLTELREKAGAMPVDAGLPTAMPAGGVVSDALSALTNLGYRRIEAQPAVARAVERLGETAELDAVIRESLKDLAQRSPA